MRAGNVLVVLGCSLVRSEVFGENLEGLGVDGAIRN